MREPAERLVVRREANRRTVVVGVVLDVVPDCARREAEPPRGRNEAVTAPYEIAKRVGVDLARLREANAVANVSQASLEAQRPGRLDVDVGPGTNLVLPVPRNDADVVVEGRGEVITGCIGAAGQTEGVALVPAVREDRPVPHVELALVEVEALHSAGRILIPQLT